MKDIFVKKRDGTVEKFNPEKINRVCSWACEGIAGVAASEIVMRAHMIIDDGVETSDIHKSLIIASNNIVEEGGHVNYTHVASRLSYYDIRKEVYQQFQPLSLYSVVKSNTKIGYYSSDLMSCFTREEFEYMDTFIKHERDDNLLIGGMEQMRGKYLIKNRVTNKYYESPQMLYWRVAATGFINDHAVVDGETRMDRIRKFYNAISTQEAGIATPLFAGLGTPVKQFSSCVGVDVADNLKSIGASAVANMLYVAAKAGLGNNIGRIREEGAEIRGGQARHTGLIPFIKLLKAATKSCSQGGIRGGAMTAYYPIWHYDSEKLLVLKNNSGTEENRERHIDYGVQFNGYLLNRMMKNQPVSLFSPTLDGLYESFFSDQKEFARLYEKYEKDPAVKKKTVDGMKLLKLFLTERLKTGRLYFMASDLANINSPFDESVHAIYMSNLCAEILIPSVPFEDVNKSDGEIFLCTLSNVNWGVFKKPEDMRAICRLLVRFLDNVLSYQDYPVGHAQNSTNKFRPLGIGVNNLAYFIAKRGGKYGDPEILKEVDKWMQHQAYYLQEASIDLAEERGACDANSGLVRANGIMSIDQYKRTVDELVEPVEYLDWNLLRERAKIHGVRNATLIATPPSESNSQIIKATNGVEPVRAPITLKDSPDGKLPLPIPEYSKLKNKYDYLWSMQDMQGYIKTIAVLQKYHDQSISANTSYNPENYPNKTIPMSVVMKDFLTAYKYGLPTLYYNNMKKVNSNENKTEEPTENIVIIDDDDCEACKL